MKNKREKYLMFENILLRFSYLIHEYGGTELGTRDGLPSKGEIYWVIFWCDLFVLKRIGTKAVSVYELLARS